jgi:magnesium transporter
MNTKVERTKLLKKHSKKAGLPPGTLVHIGEKKAESVRITYLDYDEQNFQEKQVTDIEECFPFKETPTVTWINIDGIHEVSIIEKVGKHFDLHPLILEDILNTTQRPKFEDYDSHLFLVLKMLRCDGEKQIVQSEQISIVVGHKFALSFQENVGDVFEPIRDRIRKAKGRIRKMNSDYLAYALLDAVVDGYFSVLETTGDKIESIEERLEKEPSEEILRQIHSLKRQMIFLRKSIWPLRELISNLQRSESNLIAQSTGVFLRDVYDHTIQVIDTVESYRDIVSSMLDLYLSSISNSMNAVMKVLTIIATIFIPLTFVAGIYGMNFKYMPELEWRWGYALALLVMIAIAIGMVIYILERRNGFETYSGSDKFC